MHIGIITGEYPPMEGGVGDYTRELSNALTHLGHRVDILTSYHENAHKLEDNHLQVTQSVQRWSVLNSYPTIQRWLRDTSPDIINIQYQAAAYQMKAAMNLLPKYLALTQGPPTIVTYHDLLPPYLFPKAGNLRDWSVRYLAQNTSGVIVTNESDRRSLVGALGTKCPPVAIIPIGSNIPTKPPSDFHLESWRVKKGIKDSDLLLGFFGFMNRGKGVDILVSAVKKLYDDGFPVKLIFIGGRTGTSDITNSEYADYIDEKIVEQGIGDLVLKTGFVAQEEVSAALLSIDICTLPYLEGASLRHGTLHAALTHGCSIITTMSSQVNPQLKDGSVFLIPPNDSNALVEAIVHLWENRQLRLSLKDGARVLSRRFGWDNIAAETASFFHQCLA